MSATDVGAFVDQILSFIDIDSISSILKGGSLRKRRQSVDDEAIDMLEKHEGENGGSDTYKNDHKGRPHHKKGHKYFYEKRKHRNIPFGFCPSTLLNMEYKMHEQCGMEIFDASQRWTAGCSEDIDGVKQCLGFQGKK